MSKTFGATQAVRDLDLDVPRGSLCGFLGPNGAGKSTTIRMIMSIIYPDTGSIDVLGSSALKNKDRIGYLPEERGVYRKMRVGEFIEYLGRLKGVRGPVLRQRTEQWLERMELPDCYRRRCQELSKGMQQKVQFIASIIHEPDLLILDEPFSGLDPVNSALLNRMFQELHSNGVTIIFSTHVLHQAEQLCDRIFLIHKGQKLLDATLDEIRERFNPRTMVVEPSNGTVNLRSVPGVAAAQPMGEDGQIELRLTEGADAQQVMRDILAAGPVRSVELRRITLEEVFVQMVMRDRGAAAAEQAKEELAHA
ncbi:MAG TPA: ATP-binding cassette domain-containing protein [Phycisphaerales bacterium]|nr:ATP-binding cassette domain-containing protein [Phycisphaerales bacterium]